MFYCTKVEKERCISCGACYAILPEVFDFDDDGLAENKTDQNMATLPLEPELVDLLLEAAHDCPTSAILIIKEKEAV